MIQFFNKIINNIWNKKIIQWNTYYKKSLIWNKTLLLKCRNLSTHTWKKINETLMKTKKYKFKYNYCKVKTHALQFLNTASRYRCSKNFK